MDKSAIFWSALLAFIIGLGSSVVTAVVEAKGNLPSAGSWIVALFGALVVGAKDARSLMKLPPVDDGRTPPSRLPLLLFLFGVLVFGGYGCVFFKAKPAKVAANVSDVSKITVEAALRAWNDYIPVGKPSLNQQEQVREAWKKYKSAQVVLLDCAILVKETEAVGVKDPQAQEALNISIAEASHALSDLIKLLRTFNVKI